MSERSEEVFFDISRTVLSAGAVHGTSRGDHQEGTREVGMLARSSDINLSGSRPAVRYERPIRRPSANGNSCPYMRTRPTA